MPEEKTSDVETVHENPIDKKWLFGLPRIERDDRYINVLI